MCEPESIVESEADCSIAPTTCSRRKRVSGKTAQAASRRARSSSPPIVASRLSSRKARVPAMTSISRCKSKSVRHEIVGQDVERLRANRAAGRLSIGSTSGRPNSSAQARLTASRAKARFSRMRDPAGPVAGDRCHRRRAIPWRTARSQETVSISPVWRFFDFVAARLRRECRGGCFASGRRRRPASWKSRCVQDRTGGRGTRRNRSARPGRRARRARPADSGSGPRSWSGSIVTVTKFVAGVSVHSPVSAIRCRTTRS